MRILLDECIPIAARRFFGSEHEAVTVEYMGWKGKRNGALLAAAEAAGFDVLVTSDANMYQDHDLTGRNIGVAVLPSNKLKTLKEHAGRMVELVLSANRGQYLTRDLAWLEADDKRKGTDGSPP